MAPAGNQPCRLNIILQQLVLQGAVSVTELSELLSVSAVTIRKDLRLLEQQGKLTVVPGGAICCGKQSFALDDAHCAVKGQFDLKRAVARKAASLIEDGDSLITTSGMTPHLSLSYASACRDLKILTDSLPIAEEFCQRKDYQVIILGGEIDQMDMFVHGRDAVRQAKLYMADKAIVTMDGISPVSGLTTKRLEGADTLKAILARSRMRIIVADSTKIGLESFCNIAPIDKADILVTNATDDPEKLEILEQIAGLGVKILYAEPIV